MEQPSLGKVEFCQNTPIDAAPPNGSHITIMNFWSKHKKCNIISFHRTTMMLMAGSSQPTSQILHTPSKNISTGSDFRLLRRTKYV